MKRYSEDGRRIFTLENGMQILCKNENLCILCQHCEIFYDDTNGPYMFICNKQGEKGCVGCEACKHNVEGKCPYFEDITDDENYEDPADGLEAFAKMSDEEKEEIRKVLNSKEYIDELTKRICMALNHQNLYLI